MPNNNEKNIPLDKTKKILLISQHEMLPPRWGFYSKMSNQNLNKLYTKFTVARGRTSSFLSNTQALRNTNFTRNIKRNHVMIAVVAILLVLAFVAGRFASGSSSFGVSDQRADAPTPIATQELNNEFKFPLKDGDGKTVAQISYLVETANLQDAFIFHGKLAKAVKGRTFLIFDLKITNPYTKTIEINAKDYLRVRVNGKEEQLAPEIHNDPIQIQANSTKYTRIGLPINDTDKNLTLLIGELTGKKETIKLTLTR